MSISALIITLNEEVNIANCLDALAWCDDIVVLDSFSTDRTESIAREYGVRFEQRAFDNYAAQRNFGLNALAYKYPWVLMVDADEVVTPELATEMLKVVGQTDDAVSLYRFRRKDHFLGKWIKHSSGYPTWFGRLVKVGYVTVEREINEEYNTAGGIGFLQEHILHYPFNKGIAAWIEKHNRYSSMEALDALKNRSVNTINYWDFAAGDPAKRRAILKKVVYSLPARPVIIFVALYIVRGGFLDGKAGFIFSLLRAFYEFLIDVKKMELKLKISGLRL